MIGRKLTQVLDWKPINQRLCLIRIKSKLHNISIIACAPTEEKDEDEKNNFYYILEAICDNCLQNDVKVIFGDLNSKIGREAFHQHQTGLHSLHTESGSRVINLKVERSMMVGSTMFPRKDIYKYMSISPDRETSNQIDYILKYVQLNVC